MKNPPTEHLWFAWRPVIVNTRTGFKWVLFEWVLRHNAGLPYGSIYYTLEDNGYHRLAGRWVKK